jgi:hypothetical protein
MTATKLKLHSVYGSDDVRNDIDGCSVAELSIILL